MKNVSGARIAGFGIVAGTLLLGGCGYKNNPVPPESVVPVAIEDLRYRLDETGVTLTWTYPGKTISGLDLAEVSTFDLYRAVVDLDDVCANCPVPFDPEPINVDGGVTSLDGEKRRLATYKSALLRPGNKYYFKVQSRTSWWASSADSNIVSFVFQVPPKKPMDVTVEDAAGAVALKWSPVTSLVDGSEVTGAVTYKVMRSEGGDDFEILRENVAATGVVDKNVSVGKTYFYKVQSSILFKENPVAGGVSKVVSISPKDVTPPAVVGGVKTVKTAKGIKIFWDRSGEKDLAGYNVYRKSGTSEKYELVGTVLAIYTTFEDKQVPVGERVFYSVSAFDRSLPPNEGPKSKPVTTRD